MKEEQLEAIGSYVKKHIAQWIKESNIIPFPADTAGILLAERMVRVEEALKHQGDLIEKILHQMDKRFEQVDKRFEQVDKRFEELRADMIIRFEQVDKRFDEMRVDMIMRFEQVDKRFEDMNKRFSQMFIYLTTIFAVIGALVSVFGFMK